VDNVKLIYTGNSQGYQRGQPVDSDGRSMTPPSLSTGWPRCWKRIRS